MYTKNLIFDYATQYQFNVDSIAPVESFDFNDEMYADFTEFLKDKEFDYTPESQKLLDQLEKAIEKDKYTDRLSGELDDLRTKLTHDKEKDLEMFKGEIEGILREEIVSRYYYQTGRAKAMIMDDPLVDSAIVVLNSKERYNVILSVN